MYLSEIIHRGTSPKDMGVSALDHKGVPVPSDRLCLLCRESQGGRLTFKYSVDLTCHTYLEMEARFTCCCEVHVDPAFQRDGESLKVEARSIPCFKFQVNLPFLGGSQAAKSGAVGAANSGTTSTRYPIDISTHFRCNTSHSESFLPSGILR